MDQLTITPEINVRSYTFAMPRHVTLTITHEINVRSYPFAMPVAWQLHLK